MGNFQKDKKKIKQNKPKQVNKQKVTSSSNQVFLMCNTFIKWNIYSYNE